MKLHPEILLNPISYIEVTRIDLAEFSTWIGDMISKGPGQH
jgi:hypothetical protein